ncbi:MAG TPA: ROK family protein, partial [Candidatus Acidoferrum sp.]|nr:ROK family protein [Candidatus Acidoferrum sp.]
GKTSTLAHNPDEAIEDLATLVKESVADAGLTVKQIDGVGIGAPGAVDPERGMVYKAPNLGWNNVPLGPALKRLLHVPIIVDNDVNAGTVGEHALGAGERVRDMVGIFVGTGIGAGIILGGKLYYGCRGSAGEIGHTVLEVDGPRCGCGRRGCVEALASRTAMERDVRAAIKSGRKSAVLQIMKERNRTRMTSGIIARALKNRDPVMREVMKRAQYYLGVAVANAVNMLDPARVVIGGGIAERLGEDFVAPMRPTAYAYFLNQDNAQRIKILPGSLGDNAGAMGAVVLTRQRLGKA